MPHIPATSLQTRNNSDKLLYVDIPTTWLSKSTKSNVPKYRKIAIERQVEYSIFNCASTLDHLLYDHIKIGPGSSQKDQFKKMKGSDVEDNGNRLNNEPRFAPLLAPQRLNPATANSASKIS